MWKKLPLGEDSVAEFGEVLAISDGGEVTIGSPYVAGAKVVAQVLSQYKDKKIIVFKYKSKTRYRRKNSHRQSYTRVLIQDIKLEQTSGRTARKPSTKPRTRRTPARAGGKE